MNLLHTPFPKLCVRHLRWMGNTLACRKCGRPAGFRYQLGDRPQDLYIFLFKEFRPYMDLIENMPSTHQIDRIDDVLGRVSFVDFDTALNELRDSMADIGFHAFDGLGTYTWPDNNEEEEFNESEEADDEVSASFRDDSADPVASDGNVGASDGEHDAESERGNDPDAKAGMAALDGGGSP